jgi:hypothetical protein
MKLLGGKEFIKSEPGTFYIEFWEHSEKDCLKIIEVFKRNPKELLTKENLMELRVFGDNGGSMNFQSEEGGEEDEDFIYYWDANVIGDASPTTTLYLVLEEDELPEEITIEKMHVDGYNIGYEKLSKKRIIRIRNIFKEYGFGYKASWVEEAIKEYTETSAIFNINL